MTAPRLTVQVGERLQPRLDLGGGHGSGRPGERDPSLVQILECDDPLDRLVLCEGEVVLGVMERIGRRDFGEEPDLSGVDPEGADVFSMVGESALHPHLAR